MNDEPLKLTSDQGRQILERHWALEMSKSEKRKVKRIMEKVLADDVELARFLTGNMRRKVEII